MLAQTQTKLQEQNNRALYGNLLLRPTTQSIYTRSIATEALTAQRGDVTRPIDWRNIFLFLEFLAGKLACVLAGAAMHTRARAKGEGDIFVLCFPAKK